MKKHNLREQSKILVEHILAKDPLSANKVFAKLIMEAEEAREDEVSDELGLDDSTDNSENSDVPEIDSFESDNMNNEETDKIVDDIVEINCQINAKVISNLFDKIAELKTNIENLNLDENSREYLKYEVTIQYYSDKLQDLQNKTNPGVDQSKIESALQKIESALDQLEGEIGGNNDTEVDDIQTPEEVSAENDLTEPDESEADTDGDTNSDANENAVENADESDESDESDEEKSEDSSEEEDIDQLFG